MTTPIAPAPLVLAPAMLDLYARIDQVARSNLSVLVEGETGVGKQEVARRIHERSGREGRFVIVDCGALCATLREGQLYGHLRGAFSGADADRSGLIEDADGGTLFLDEIGDASPELQLALMRVADGGGVQRIGETDYRKVDVRIVAATLRDILALVEQGRFREDFSYRLREWPLFVPPLRDRREEIAPLADRFAREMSPDAYLTSAAIAHLEAQRWPGNVRELRSAVRRAVVRARGSKIDVDHLDDQRPFVSIEATQASWERTRILRALESCGGNVCAAARALGLERSALRRRLLRHDIDARIFKCR